MVISLYAMLCYKMVARLCELLRNLSLFVRSLVNQKTKKHG